MTRDGVIGNATTIALIARKQVACPAWVRYGVAIIGLAMATLVNLLVDDVFPGHTKYLWLLLSFIFTAWFGGFGPAILNLLLGPVVLIVFIMHPRFNLHVESPADQFGVVLYAMTTFALFGFLWQRRKARDHLSSLEDGLVLECSKSEDESQVIGNYVLMEQIGAGGMGVVFKARHRVMNRIAALKILPTSLTQNQAAVDRFHRESLAAATLNHPNVVTAFDADCANGVHFLIMEFVDGCDLAALVKMNGPLPIEKAVNYIWQAANGLAAVHAQGIVHRDIKPSNLLLDKCGTVKILDMGLARLSEDTDNASLAQLTNTGIIMGTVDFMAPEQALDMKAADARADIYALGCSLYYLLTGKVIYDFHTIMKRLVAHREQSIPSLRSARADVPEMVDTVFKKMVAKKVEDRYQKMTEVVAALELSSSGYGIPGDRGSCVFVRTIREVESCLQPEQACN